MTIFWLVAAGLVLLAYALFWWSLRRPPKVDDQAQLNANLNVHRSRRLELEQERREGKLSSREFDQLVTELDRELLDAASPRTEIERAEGFQGLTAVTATLAILPLIALALYFGLGRPDLIGAGAKSAPSQNVPDSLQAGIERLKQRLRDNPDDPRGWMLLARSFQAMNRLDEAQNAYEQALHLVPEDLDLKARYAEVLAQRQQGDLRGKPLQLVREILDADPNHPYALWLSGLAALHAGDREQARRHWQALLDQMPPGSSAAEQLRAMITKAGLSLDAQPTATATVQVRAKVQLAPDLLSHATPEDQVYIFARAAQGPPMPLAIVRKRVKDLPVTVILDDSMAMMPQMKLSNFDRIVLGARVAKSGNAKGAPGDLEGWTNPVSIDDDDPHVIVIDEVRS
ncbi:MAG: c-type cytochrome biogenesis protein CcmI [Methylohalobius crimeensis]